MLNKDLAALIFIDVQGRLAEVMHDKETLDQNLSRLIKGAHLLELPILATEQIPEKLGGTNEPFKSELGDTPFIPKTAFSCCGEPQFMDQLAASGKKQAILIGIETHVCVYQTAIDLLEQGYEVFIAADAVSSRALANKTAALNAIQAAGGTILTTEMILFALLRNATNPHFKEILKLVK